ncbi:FHA domain-containing protein [uncultured Microscilla sp.]|uniref:FHA domain-containing protein n=1 Tax=uncultured Microscilla sp. TaxID=432653 RepID=UPI002634B4C5|nr:FHA domain-containing protein [uncultured Microscilla sp.]
MTNKETLAEKGKQTQPNRATQAFATGLKILGGADVPIYTLQHLTNTDKHPAGSYEKIVVPYIEIGRANSCVIQFDDGCNTVSRKHAAIERKGKDIFIKNLSATNPTLINGRPVAEQWYLTNGDEIQLSLEGPKLLFNVSATGTAKLGLTNRMNLVIKQAVKPYKNAFLSLLLLLIASIAVAGYIISNQGNIINSNKDTIARQQITLAGLKKANSTIVDSLDAAHKNNTRVQKELSNTKDQMEAVRQAFEQRFRALKAKASNNSSNRDNPGGGGNSNNNTDNPGNANIQGLLKQAEGDVYFIYSTSLDVTYPDGTTEEIKSQNELWSGTGFLLNDGRFVTARHVVEPWYYFKDNKDPMMLLNTYANNGGKIVANMVAVSPTGKKITLTNTSFIVDRTKDQPYTVQVDEDEFAIKKAQLGNGTDWAYFKTSTTGSLQANAALSSNLKRGTELHVLGFPYGLSLQNQQKLEPVYSKNEVGQNGLVNESITVTGRSFDTGNSGGPAFTTAQGKLVVIGIISAGRGVTGSIIPISAIK